MKPPTEKPIIFFDGVCNLCNGFVQFIIKRDRKGRFRFASLQSAIARELIPGLENSQEGFQTVILLDQGKIYLRSRAVLRILRQLDGAWKLSAILYVFPSFLSDTVYNLVSRTRYRIFGKQDSCMVPTPDLKNRFI